MSETFASPPTSPSASSRNYSLPSSPHRPSDSFHSRHSSSSYPTESPFNPPSSSSPTHARNGTATSDYTSLKFDHLEESDGDLGGGSLGGSARKNKGKGKARMVDMELELEESNGWSPNGKGNGHGMGYDLEEEEEDEGAVEAERNAEEEEKREEQRVADNLANWSRLEKSRRQTQRRTSTLVLPSGPPIPAPITAGAVGLARRGSQLIRRASTRTAKGGGGTLSGGTERKGSVRKGSRRLDDERTVGDGEGVDNGRELDELAEAEERSSLRGSAGPGSPGGIERPILGINTRNSSNHSSDPFSDTLLSPTDSAESTTPKTATATTSRFIEDLPTQSPTTPTRPAPTSNAEDVLKQKDSIDSRRSNNTRGESIDDLLPSLHPVPPTSISASRPQPTTLLSYQSQSPNVTRSYMSLDDEGEGGEEDDYHGEGERDEKGLGWLDWLCCCGCWGEESAEDRQVGRTNPCE